MICTSIQNRNLEEILDILAGVEMAEIRLDRCPLSEDEIGEVFSSDVPLVATCRIADVAATDPFLSSPECSFAPESKLIKAAQIAEKRLMKAVKAGAKFVDLEMEAPKAMSKRMKSFARENGALFIRSYHDFEGTDSVEALKALVEKCQYHGAEIVKIVTTAHSEADVAKLMSLYDAQTWKGGDAKVDPSRLIAFCMGEAGKPSRYECLKKGAPYTYAALSAEESAAPGQIPYEQMLDEVYGDFGFIDGVAEVPASKSFAQRAIVAAALADGMSRLHGYSSCGDTDAALAVAEAMGAKVELKGRDITIEGIGAAAGKLDLNTLHTGESGLLTRLMIPLACQLCRDEVTITGEKTLASRPLKGVPEMMDAFGAYVRGEGGECIVPLKVGGSLRNGRVEISGRNGSQLISGLLMALPFAEKNTTIDVLEPKSIPYMFITLDVLKQFGIRINNDMLGGKDFLESEGDWSLCSELVFKVRGGQHYKSTELTLEGDWSAAANFLVAGAIFGRVEVAGLDTGSLQADLTIMDILMDAGASLSQFDDGGNILVQRAPLNAFNVDASNCPDLFPIISVLAAFCQGRSRIGGVGRLAHKESNRAVAIVNMLTQMGVEALIEGDDLLIDGLSLAQRCLLGKMIKGGNYTSCHDHRMVMALKVASLGADSPIIIDDEACVAKSFPDFLQQFEQL